MKCFRIVCAVGMLLLLGTCLPAQQPCQPYSYDLHLCEDPTQFTVGAPAIWPGPYSYTWGTNPSNATYISGQGQSAAVFQATGYGHININVSIYSYSLGCGWPQTMHYYRAQYSTPNIIGTVPSNCASGQTYTYYATRWASTTTPNTWAHWEDHYWGVTGGTIVGNSSSTSGLFQPPYGYWITDTVKVQWNPNGTRYLRLTRMGTHVDNTVPGNSSCPNSDTLFPAVGSAYITGPNAFCNSTTATYSVPNDTGYTYNWTISGGTIASGQGTSTVQVNWTSAGSITATKTYNWCPYTASYTKNVTLTPLAAPNIGPTTSICTGTPITIYGGTYNSYLWSTGATTADISPTTSGTYSLTVTNAQGCTATAARTINFYAAPTPNLPATVNLCPGQSQVLNPGVFSSYAWSNGATTPSITASTAGTYALTVTDGSGCTGTGATMVSMLPSPTFSLGNDTVVCADTSIVVAGPGGMSAYAWSTGNTTAAQTISTSGAYGLTVTDANGCTASDDIVVQGLSDCVFPGDANYDGLADNLDILSIGAYSAFTGQVRPAASLGWYGQALSDWGGALPGQADPKHSDCDGSGTVDGDDTLAVVLNLGQAHSKAAGITGAGDTLFVVPLQDTVTAGDIAWFSIRLGNAGQPVDSVHGLALTVTPTSQAPLSMGVQTVDYSNCWFAGAGQRLTMTYPLGGSAGAVLAVTRTDGLSQAGQGEACRVGVLTDAGMAQAYAEIGLSVSALTLVDGGLAHVPMTVSELPSVVTTVTTSSSPWAATGIKVFPNPAADKVSVWSGETAIGTIQVLDMRGRLLLEQQPSGGEVTEVPTAGLPAGSYLLRIVGAQGPTTLQLRVLHP